MDSPTAHAFRFQQLEGDNPEFQWLIFCPKCGRVAWIGKQVPDWNATRLQNHLPESCIPDGGVR